MCNKNILLQKTQKLQIRNKTIMQIKVDCYCGYRGEETPKFISIGIRKIEVRKILDQWLAPDHRYFKVIGDDNAIYIIRHDQEKWQWELTFFSETENYANFKATL